MHPVSFINSALVRLREDSITSAQYDAENLNGSPSVKKAWTCRKIFEDVLGDLLRSHNWNCIVKRVELSKDSDNPPAWGFSNRFLLPADYVRMVEVWLDGERIKSHEPEKQLRIEDDDDITVGSIVTDSSEVAIRYVYMPTSFEEDSAGGDYSVPDSVQTFLSKFDRSLRETIVSRLSSEFGYVFTGSTTVEQIKSKKYLDQLGEAQSSDSQDEGPEEIESDILLRVRN